MAAWVARDSDIRSKFDLVLWLTLSQSPNVPKLQSLLMLQTTGTDFPKGLETPPMEVRRPSKTGGCVYIGLTGRAQAKELLTQALRGRNALLILDDCWEKVDEEMLNTIDISAGSRLLVTTRIKGLLSEAEQLEVGLPGPEDAAKLLLKSAGIKGDAPPQALEVVEICGA
jgi:hypothetical protein